MSLMMAFKDALLPARLTLWVGRIQFGPVHPFRANGCHVAVCRVSAAWPGQAVAIPSEQLDFGSDGLLLRSWRNRPGAQRKRRKLIPQFSLDRADGSRFAGCVLPQVAVFRLRHLFASRAC